MIVFISGQFLVADTQLHTRGFVPPSVHWFVHGSVRQWCSSRKWEKNEHFRCFVYVCCGGWGVYGHLMPLPYRLQRYNVTSRDLLTNDHSSQISRKIETIPLTMTESRSLNKRPNTSSTFNWKSSPCSQSRVWALLEIK